MIYKCGWQQLPIDSYGYFSTSAEVKADSANEAAEKYLDNFSGTTEGRIAVVNDFNVYIYEIKKSVTLNLLGKNEPEITF